MEMKRLKFTIGKEIDINDLDHPINNEFISLYKSFFGNLEFNLDSFKKESFDFFDKFADSPFSKQDSYFENFYALWENWIARGNYREAEKVWVNAIRIAREWENIKQKRIHKGTPFYFWAVTCILEGDLERGFWSMNQSYLEDIETLKMKEPETPAKKFLYFDAEGDQFFKNRLLEVKKFLEKNFIEYYTTQRNRTLTYTLFENKFLKKSDINKEVKFHFNFCIFRLEKLFHLPLKSLSNTIQSLLYLDIIFDLCKVLEILIDNLGTSMKIVCREGFLKDIKGLSKKYNANTPIIDIDSNDFNTETFLTTLQNIFENKYKINNQILNNDLEKDILITYGFRNFGAHKIKEDSIIIENFESIIKSIINSILLAIEIK